LVLMLIGVTPAAAEIRVHVTLCNNTQATLSIKLGAKYKEVTGLTYSMSDAGGAPYGEYTVPPVTCLRAPNGLRMGASLMDVYALNVSGQPGFTKEFWVTKTTPLEFAFFDRDFGVSTMFDSRGGGRPIAGGPFDGTWETRQLHTEGPWRDRRFAVTLEGQTTAGITRMAWADYRLEGRMQGNVYPFRIYRGGGLHGEGQFALQGNEFFTGTFKDRYGVSGTWKGCRAPCNPEQMP
jgi:hypothetical protein